MVNQDTHRCSGDVFRDGEGEGLVAYRILERLRRSHETGAARFLLLSRLERLVAGAQGDGRTS